MKRKIAESLVERLSVYCQRDEAAKQIKALTLRAEQAEAERDALKQILIDVVRGDYDNANEINYAIRYIKDKMAALKGGK